jgi:hypothetical protein
MKARVTLMRRVAKWRMRKRMSREGDSSEYNARNSELCDLKLWIVIIQQFKQPFLSSSFLARWVSILLPVRKRGFRVSPSRNPYNFIINNEPLSILSSIFLVSSMKSSWMLIPVSALDSRNVK